MEKEYKLLVSYQPINKCWGVLFKKGIIVHNEVDKHLSVALFNMGKFLLKLSNK